MFTRTSAAIERRIATLHRGVDDATRDRDAIQPEVSPLAAHLAERDAVLARANADLVNVTNTVTAAAGGLDAALTTRTAARVRVDRAEDVLQGHREAGPDLTDHDEIRQWGVTLRRLEADLAEAQKHLTAAEAAVAPVQAARDAAHAALPPAIQARDDASTSRDLAAGRLAAAQNRLAAAQAALADALDTLSAQLPALTARLADLRNQQVAILAEPMDRAAVERAAELTLADLLDRRHHRYRLFAKRAAAAAARAAALTAQDGTVDELATLRADINSWADRPRFPALLDTATAIDAIVAASNAQRTRPPAARTDDLASAHLTLATRVAALEALHAQAVGDRNVAIEAIRTASTALMNHQLEV